jgi:multicomponent Na+:H+ antiporter subunit G
MEMVLNVASWAFILAGSFFYIVGGIGLLRMPDVFTRMHAAGSSDTMGAALLLIGMMLQAGVSLVLAKLLMLLFFILFTGPVATHALARAARYAGVEPILAGKTAKKVKQTPAKNKKAAPKATPEVKKAKVTKAKAKPAAKRKPATSKAKS